MGCSSRFLKFCYSTSKEKNPNGHTVLHEYSKLKTIQTVSGCLGKTQAWNMSGYDKLDILRVCFDHDCFSLVSKPPWFLRLWNTFFTSHVIYCCHAADFPMAPTCAPRLTGRPASHAVAPAAAKETEPGRGWRFRSAASSLPNLVPKMGIHLARGGVEVCI